MNPFINRLRALKIRIPMKNFLYLLGLMLCIGSCADDSKLKPEIEGLSIDFTVKRFDKALAAATPSDIPTLKKEYPYFFSKRYDESYWKTKMKDTLQKEIESEVAKTFLDMSAINDDLELLFKHIKYYFPTTTIPKTIMVATDVDYRNKIILTDSLLFVSLSSYLGSEHFFYEGIARFHAQNFRKEQIEVDVAHAFAKAKTPNPQSSQLIAHFIYEGKKLYLMKQLLSLTPEHELFSFTPEELEFARANEVNIWEYFVSREMLFSTDRKLLSRFIDPAPFSKFYLDFDNETPGGIGRYIGYQIVYSFMTNNDVSLQSMFLQDAETIFNNAKYKP